MKWFKRVIQKFAHTEIRERQNSSIESSKLSGRVSHILNAENQAAEEVNGN